MKSYVVVDKSARLGPGAELTLTAEQLADRRHNLEVMVEDGERAIVRTVTHVEFKAGETFEMEGTPPKSVAAVVVTPEVAEQKAAEAAAVSTAKAKRASTRRRRTPAKSKSRKG